MHCKVFHFILFFVFGELTRIEKRRKGKKLNYLDDFFEKFQSHENTDWVFLKRIG